MIIDKIAVTYDSFEELVSRQSTIEQTALNYLKDNPIANRIESIINVTDNKFVLQVNLIED